MSAPLNDVRITRKRVKRLNVRVCPPHGEVRVSAPWWMSERDIHNFLHQRRDWIEQCRQRQQQRQAANRNDMCAGEMHRYLGLAYPLRLYRSRGRPSVTLQCDALCLHISAEMDAAQRLQLLQGWYRQQLQAMLPQLRARWQPVVGAQAAECRIKRMSTRWGSCNPRARRIWLSLELIKQPLECIDYVMVHELVHLHEASHNHRFHALMDQCMPDWRERRRLLNAGTAQ
ncbi:MAG: SprT family zinc-dependent metalloprotease [Wenzhouxiangellaceae bacterium]